MTLKKRDILVIDDEPVIAEAVVRICTAEGYAVDTAADAPSGIECTRTTSYLAILCDIMMPDMDGFQFLAEMNKRKIATPVVMSTGFSTLENAVKSLNEGAIDFVPKPFTVDELLSAIRRALKYGEIQTRIRTGDGPRSTDSLFYVPCPSRYSRLGYRSWVQTENDGTAQIGVTDLFVKTVGDVQRIELLRINDEIIQGSACAEIFTGDGLAHQVLCPLSGRIVQKNDQLLSTVSLIEKDPYFEGWMYRMIPSDLEYEFKHLIPCSSDRL